MRLWGKSYSKREILKRVGDISQVCGVKKMTFDDGPARGMRVFDVTTGAGLSFSVLPDRGMDIGWCHYKSIPMGFISKTGAVSPYLFEYGGANFLRGFTAGLLTTCGYTFMGAPCVDNGEELGLHGRATALVSDNTSSSCGFDGDDYVMRIRGTMTESVVFGENIHCTREILVKAGENRIFITDEIENHGFKKEPLMLLYHFNFGHPLVSPDTKLVTSDCKGVAPRDKTAKAGIADCRSFEEPTHGYAEQVFYHSLNGDADGRSFAGLVNEDLGIAVKLLFYNEELPYLVEWKQMGEGEYVCGIEPATWKPEGRAKARESGELMFIEAGGKKSFRLELCIEDL